MESDRKLDTQGLLCPEPLMLARNALREMDSGQVLYISATDPSTHRDFQNLCRFMGHELLEARVDAPVLEYWIQRA
ncbi:MAG: sulfurtransferase TusA [Pseudomonadota bacterium]